MNFLTFSLPADSQIWVTRAYFFDLGDAGELDSPAAVFEERFENRPHRGDKELRVVDLEHDGLDRADPDAVDRILRQNSENFEAVVLERRDAPQKVLQIGRDRILDEGRVAFGHGRQDAVHVFDLVRGDVWGNAAYTCSTDTRSLWPTCANSRPRSR